MYVHTINQGYALEVKILPQCQLSKHITTKIYNYLDDPSAYLAKAMSLSIYIDEFNHRMLLHINREIFFV